MTVYDQSLGSPVVWGLLFAFVFLEYLNTYICFIFFRNILVHKLLFFIVFWLSLHLDEFMRIFHFLMLVSVQQWRLEIGTFSCRYILRYPQNCNFFMKGKTVVVGFVFGFMLNFFVVLYFCYILLTHGDIEVNPGPKKNCSTIFSFCRWNLNSLIAHNYVKPSSL